MQILDADQTSRDVSSPQVTSNLTKAKPGAEGGNDNFIGGGGGDESDRFKGGMAI
jgi:hypothetical protein